MPRDDNENENIYMHPRFFLKKEKQKPTSQKIGWFIGACISWVCFLFGLYSLLKLLFQALNG